LALLVAVRVQTLPDPLGRLSSRSILFAEPLCRDNAQGAEALTQLIAEHDAEMRGRVLFTEVRALHPPKAEKAALTRCGYVHEDYLNFIIDLHRSGDELWQSLSNTCRANIRRGQKHGVEIEEVTTKEGVDILYQLLKVSFVRAQVPLADKSLFAQAFKVLQPRDMLRIFVAYYEARPIGASVVLLYKNTVYEWYWGIQITKSVYPAESVTWHRIKWGQEHGYALYDFGGAGWPNKPYGVRDFKAKFGGRMVNFGRYRKIYSHWKFALAERGYELSRMVMNPKLRKGRQPQPKTAVF
jgi:serine/alanine adding enzyme